MSVDRRIITAFWHNPNVPDEVESIRSAFQEKWKDYRYLLYDDESAIEMIRSEYGWEISKLYESCKIPAMRSDLFRVLSVYLTGGGWVDVKFMPRGQPDKIIEKLSCGGIVVCRWFHGRIVNGVFFAAEGALVLDEIIKRSLSSVRKKEGDNVFLVTGPGLWNNVLEEFSEGVDYTVLEHDDLFSYYLAKQKFELSGRGGEKHWSVAQNKGGLYL